MQKNAPLPFHKNLNGWERVNRAFARKCWSWGLPVWLDAGHGSARLRAPGSVPACDPKAGFDEACAGAAGAGVLAGPARRRCVYLAPWGRTALHFKFADGSNPFVKYGVAAELLPELYAWSLDYRMRPEPAGSDRIAGFVLEEKAALAGLFEAISQFRPAP